MRPSLILIRVLVVVGAIAAVLTGSPSVAVACSVSYEGGGTDPNNGCATAASIVGAAVVGGVAVGAIAVLTIVNLVRGRMSESEFSTLLSHMTGQQEPEASNVADTSPEILIAPPRDLPTGGSAPGDRPTDTNPESGGWPHVRQRAGDWCGAASGEMAARRLGVRVTQDQLAASPHFQPELWIGDRLVAGGGFQTIELQRALAELAPVPGRQWRGGQLPHDLSTPDALQEVLKGYLDSTGASIILRVQGGSHWIVVDHVTPDGLIAIRDPAAPGPAIVTAEQVHALHPVGEAVFSFPHDG